MTVTSTPGATLADDASATVVVTAWRPTPLTSATASDLAALDAIFFGASGTQSFASPEVRSAFRERWLGRYLSAPDGIVLVARALARPGGGDGAAEPAGNGAIVGYVIGTLVDPARDRRFDDIAYFRDLREATALYPAHLHINCAPQWRSRGVGATLIEAFCAEARARGAPGVHIVTGAGLRNVGFYERNGFREVGRALSNGKPVVMLGRRL